MKKTIFALIIIIIIVVPITFFVVSCDIVISGSECNVKFETYAETDDYIIFPTAIYDKNNQTFIKTLTKDEKMYDSSYNSSITVFSDSFMVVSTDGSIVRKDTFGFDGKNISNQEILDEENQEKHLIKGFYSSQNRINLDNEELTESEKKIWDYCKNKSVKDKWPYLIEGTFKETEEEIVFNVNVYNKVEWAGQSLVNEGIVSSTLNSYNKATKEIVELYSFDKCIIKDFYDKYIYYYKKSDKCLYYQNLITKESKKIRKNRNFIKYYTTDKYCLICDMNKNPYSFDIIELE